MSELVCFVIDDDPDDLEAFELATKDIDVAIECLTARSGEEGLKKLDELSAPPQYIFLDIKMPGMDGWECLRNIKLRPELKNVPVIILSTAQSLKDRRELHPLEIARYIIKPNSQKDLTDAISKVFRKEIVL